MNKSEDAESCLIAKLSHYVNLSEKDKSLISMFEQEEADFEPRRRVFETDKSTTRLYVVRRGWVYAWSSLPDGRRQVEDVHLPGDIIGMRDVAFQTATSNLSTLTECTLCPFPKSALDDVFEQSPRITALMFTLALLQTTLFVDRLRAVARMSADERICHFVLQLFHRLRVTNKSMSNTFRFPLTQELMGDCVGLSQVHVNRTFQELTERGWLKRSRNDIELLEPDEMRKACKFEDRFHEIDISWFPKRQA